MITVYGIANCDTVRKARDFLASQGLEHVLHDFKRSGIERARLEAWCERCGWERVINRAGQTFRKLDPALREGLDRERAIALMLAQPSMIKRPVLDLGDRCLLGFDAAAWREALT